MKDVCLVQLICRILSLKLLVTTVCFDETEVSSESNAVDGN